MQKGRHRRNQQARELKHQTNQPMLDKYNESDLSIPADAVDEIECIECLRWPHAEWCRAEEDAENGPQEA